MSRWDFPRRWTRWHTLALAAVLAHLVLALLYSAMVPPWESYDEMGHYYYAEYIARYKRLPRPGEQVAPKYNETHQPPLYYILASLPVMLAVPNDGYQVVFNPYATRSDAAAGFNMVLHDPKVEAFPWRGTILALHLARLTSVIIGTVGLLFTWRAARAFMPKEPAVAALAVTFHALVPEYLFIGSVVTNDILVAALTAAVTYYSLRLLLVTPRWHALLGLYTAFGLALAAKYSAWSLAVPTLVATGLAALRYRRVFFRETWKAMVGLVLVGSAGFALWGYRNWQQWGMVIPPGYAWRALRLLRAPQETLPTLPWEMAKPTLMYAYRTLWAAFGWANLEPGIWVVYGFTAACLLGVVGWLVLGMRRRLSPTQAAGGLWLLFIVGEMATFFLLFALSARTPHAAPARYMLGVLAPIAIFVAAGWHGLLSDRIRWPVAIGVMFLLVALNLYSLFGVIRPAYRMPRFLTPEEVQAWLRHPATRVVKARYGDAIELVAYRQHTFEVTPGERAKIEVLWHVLRPLPENYVLSAQILGRRLERFGGIHLYPGRGMYPPTVWVPDTWFTETYAIPLTRRDSLPTGGTFAFSFFLDQPGYPSLPSYDPQGRQVLVRVGRLRLAPSPNTALATPQPQCPVDATWEDGIALTGVTLAPPQPLTQATPLVLHWRATATPSEAWTVFLHVLDANGTYVFGGDGPPQQGDFPTTLWRAGDQVLDPRVLTWPRDVAPGIYRLTVGLYRPADNFRLPLQTPKPAPEPEAVLVAQAEVTPAGHVVLRCP